MDYSTKTAYLAGPDVFFPNSEIIGAEKKALLLSYGIHGLFPLDNIMPESTTTAHAIFLGNLDLIHRSAIVLANIIPFRGPSLDPGTAWEIGYAYAKGLPIICYGSSGTYRERCQTLGLEHGSVGLDQEGMSIEDFGEQENLMIARCATLLVATFAEAAVAAKKLLYPDENHNEGLRAYP